MIEEISLMSKLQHLDAFPDKKKYRYNISTGLSVCVCVCMCIFL